MSSLDLKFDADLGQIGNQDRTMTTLSTDLSEWIETANKTRLSALDAWQGEAASAFDTKAREIDEAARDVLAKLDAYRSALTELFHSLSGVNSDLQSIREDAQAAGLIVSGNAVLEPVAPQFIRATGSPPPTAANNAQVARYELGLNTYNSLATRLNEVRSRESRAHNTFERACERAVAPQGWDFAWRALGIPDSAGSLFFFALENSPDAANTAAAIQIQRFGRFAYRDAAGRYAALPEGFLAGLKAADNPANWQNAANATDDAVHWLAFGKGLKGFAGKIALPIALGFGAFDAWESGAEQWERDSYDPTLSGSSRVVRAGLEGLVDAGMPLAGAAAGAGAGALGGAAIGSVVPLLGTVVGGAVGGIVGGFVGAWSGQAAADASDTDREELIDVNVRW